MKTKKKVSSNTSRVAIPAKPNELQVDLDGPEAIRLHGYYYHLLEREGLTKFWESKYEPSATPGHLHCTITLPHIIPAKDRVMLQMMLGSHLSREIYNYIRVVRKAPLPIVFFKERKSV